MAYNPNNPNGQATMANSAPVAIASNQSAIPITDNSGSLTVDNGGTFVVQENGAALTSLQILDNAVATDGSAAVTGLYQVGGTDGTNAQILSTNSSGHLNIADGSNSITVDAPVGTPVFVRLSDGAAAISTLPVSLASVPSHAVTNAGTFVVQENGAALTSLQLIDDGVATVASAITTKGMAAVGTDGTNARILKTDTSGELQVDVLTLPTVTIQDGGNTITVDNGGTFAVQAAQSGAWSIASTSTAGDVAHDTTDSGNPVKIGFKAFTTNPTRVADGDRVNGVADVAGRQVVVMNQVRDLTFHNSATLSSTTETSILAGVASTYHDITQIIATNTSASQVRVDFRDATAGSVILSISLAPSGGAVIPFAHPLKQTTANNNWTAQLSTAVTDVRIFMQAVKNT